MAHPNSPQTGRRGLHPLLTAAAVAVIVASTAVVGSSLNLWPSVGAQERTVDQRAADDAQGDESARQQAQGVAGSAAPSKPSARSRCLPDGKAVATSTTSLAPWPVVSRAGSSAINSAVTAVATR